MVVPDRILFFSIILTSSVNLDPQNNLEFAVCKRFMEVKLKERNTYIAKISRGLNIPTIYAAVQFAIDMEIGRNAKNNIRNRSETQNAKFLVVQ